MSAEVDNLLEGMGSTVGGLQSHHNLTANETRRLNKILENYEDNIAVSASAYFVLIVAYSILIAIGSGGNLMVLAAVATNKCLRSSARNIFIASLALADLILCVFNMPLTLILTLTKSWPFYSDSWIFCKSILTLQAVTVFLSSFLITLIALDRRHFILNPSKKQIDTGSALKLSFAILILSFGLASPISIYSRIIYLFDDSSIPASFKSPAFCVEDFSRSWKIIYSSGSALIQYSVPSLIVCSAYCQILWRLKHRPLATGNEERRRAAEQKRRRSIKMLIIVAATYFVSWAPLNALNFIINVFDSSESPMFSQEDHFLCVYAVCHLVGMSSACLNPFLYGFMNENFQGEFRKMLECWCKVFSSIACRKTAPAPVVNGVVGFENPDVVSPAVGDVKKQVNSHAPPQPSKETNPLPPQRSEGSDCPKPDVVVAATQQQTTENKTTQLSLHGDIRISPKLVSKIQFNDKGRDAVFV